MYKDVVQQNSNELELNQPEFLLRDLSSNNQMK